MIAMALACEPELLIADEPTTALDVTVQRKILLLLKSLQQRLGMSLLLISHDLNLVRSIAQRVCVMKAGEIVEQARCETMFTAPKHPYSCLLLNAEPEGEALPRDEREKVLEVHDLRVQVCRRWRIVPTQDLPQGRGRHQPEHPARQDPGHRRRVGFRQVHAGPGDPAPAGLRGRYPLPGPAHSMA